MKIINFGSCNIDYVYSIDHVVSPGETETTDGLGVYAGGKGLNQSIALARAGAEVLHAGCIGDGGEMLIDLMRESGVDVSKVMRVDEKNGHAIIQVTKNAENSIFIYPGSNVCLTHEYIDQVLSLADKDDIVLLQNEISSVEYIIDRSYEMGLRVVFNPSPIKENVTRIDLNKLSYIILNSIEAKMITGEDGEGALEILGEKYPSLSVILTLGVHGSIYQFRGEKIYTPSFEVNAVDTTGAGDTFTGYFVAGLVSDIPLCDSLKLASAASAIAVSREGAAPSIPTQEEAKAGTKTLPERRESSRDSLLMGRIERYIKDNVRTVTLTTLAAELGYSPVYTGAILKKLFGISFTDLTVDIRLDLAKGMLDNADMSISDIIRAVGYENESHFRRKFREKFNTSPLKYKKSHK